MIIPFFLVANILSVLFFDFSYGTVARYICHIFALLIIMQGYVISKLTEKNNKIINIILILVILTTFFQIYQASNSNPPFVLDSNFNSEKFALMQDVYGDGFNYSIYQELEERGNPQIMTNLIWLSTFYDGEVFPTPLEQFGMCTDEFYDELREKKMLIIVNTPDFFTRQPWASCESFRRNEFVLVKEFEAMENPIGEEKSKLSIIRIK
jgi:hypothetical protein